MNFLQGKKTYISAALFFALGIYGIWVGLDPTVSAGALIFGFTAIGLGAKADRYAAATQLFLAASHKAQMKQPLTADERNALLSAGIQIAGDIGSVTSTTK